MLSYLQTNFWRPGLIGLYRSDLIANGIGKHLTLEAFSIYTSSVLLLFPGTVVFLLAVRQELEPGRAKDLSALKFYSLCVFALLATLTWFFHPLISQVRLSDSRIMGSWKSEFAAVRAPAGGLMIAAVFMAAYARFKS